MSFDAFLTKLALGADRGEKIAILSSETDDITGIINGTTKVAKSYMESEGPSSNTGVVAAAVVDILELLSGGDSSVNVNIDDLLYIDNVGVGIGGAPGGARFYSAINAVFDGSITGYSSLVMAGGNLSMIGEGNIVMYPDATRTSGFINLGVDPKLRAKEGTITALLDDPFTLIEYYRGDVNFLHPWDEADYLAIGGAPAAGGWMWWREGAEDRGVDSLSNFPSMALNMRSHLYVGRMSTADLSLTGLLGSPPTQDLCVVSDDPDDGSWLHLLAKTTGAAQNGITFAAGWTGGSPVSNSNDCWQIIHEYFSNNYFGVKYRRPGLSSESWPLRFDIDDVNEKTYADFIALKKSDATYYETHLRVLSNLSLVDYFVDISPQFDQIDNRTNVPGSPTPGVAMSNGVVGNLMRIGPDSWTDHCAFRMWWESTTASYRGVIALGTPQTHGAGGWANPIDPFVIIPETACVAINADNRDLAAHAMQKTGLWVGSGVDETSGKIFLQDDGNRASVLFGDTSEPYWLFLKNGAPVIADLSSANPDSLGTSGQLGRQEILYRETLEDLTAVSGRTDTRAEVLAGTSDLNNANCGICFVRDASDVGMLFIEVQDGANRRTFYFQADGSWTT